MVEITQEEALAFCNEAFRNMDVQPSGDDLADITAALSEFAAAHRRQAEAKVEGLRREIALFPMAYDVLSNAEMRDAKGNLRSLIDQQSAAMDRLQAYLSHNPHTDEGAE